MRLKTSHKVKRPAKVPRDSDPWAFRKSAAIEDTAGMDGRRLSNCTYHRGNKIVNVPRFESHESHGEECVRSMLPELRRRVAAEISKYRTSGLCSTLDIALIEALWRDGKSMRGYARERDVSPAALGDQIERLRNRCVRFYLFWLWKNRNRRGRRRS